MWGSSEIIVGELDSTSGVIVIGSEAESRAEGREEQDESVDNNGIESTAASETGRERQRPKPKDT